MHGSCFENFNKIFMVCRSCAVLCGADIFAPNYKVNVITWLVHLCVNSFFACTGYTIYMGLVIDGDWKVILQAMCLAGSAMQGYSKLILGVSRRGIMNSMLNSLNTIYKEYQVRNESYRKVLKYRTDLIATLLKTVSLIYIFTVVVVVCYPLVFWLMHGEKMFIMQFLLPGLDPSTDVGYIVHISAHVCCMVLGAFGNFAGDMFMFIFIINIPLLKDILEIKFEEMNEVVLATHDPKKSLPLLKSIVEWHKKYNTFVEQIDTVYYGVILVEIMSSCCGICCTLFSIVIGVWPAAFAYLIYSIILLYAYCGLGHLVEISNDEVTDVIYTKCLWYELSLPEQKLVLLMIRKSQRPMTLTIGKILPLSMSTALQLTKAIYSYMMMLLNFLETDEL